MVDATESVEMLPGRPAAQRVTDAFWLAVGWSEGSPATDSQPPPWSIAGSHYFCDGADLTQPFPFQSLAAAELVWENPFCANGKWCRPLLASGLGPWCTVLVQGVLQPYHQGALQGIMLSRCSQHGARTHRFAPLRPSAVLPVSNDVECELVLFAGSAASQQWSPSYTEQMPPRPLPNSEDSLVSGYTAYSFIWRHSSSLAAYNMVPLGPFRHTQIPHTPSVFPVGPYCHATVDRLGLLHAEAHLVLLNLASVGGMDRVRVAAPASACGQTLFARSSSAEPPLVAPSLKRTKSASGNISKSLKNLFARGGSAGGLAGVDWVKPSRATGVKPRTSVVSADNVSTVSQHSHASSMFGVWRNTTGNQTRLHRLTGRGMTRGVADPSPSQAMQAVLDSTGPIALSGLRWTTTAFDWCGLEQLLGVDDAAYGLWSSMSATLPSLGLTVSHGCPDAAVRVQTKQTGLLHLSSEDGLDAVASASFFIVLQVAAEMCRRLNIGLQLAPTETPGPWGFLSLRLQELEQTVTPALCEYLASALTAEWRLNQQNFAPELAGDRASFCKRVALYAPTLLVPSTPPALSALEWLALACQDTTEASCCPRSMVSCNHLPATCCITSSVVRLSAASLQEDALRGPLALLHADKALLYTQPTELELDVTYALGTPLQLSAFVMHIGVPLPGASLPTHLDLWAGPDLDNMVLLLDNTRLPRLAQATTLTYTLPVHGYSALWCVAAAPSCLETRERERETRD